MNQEKECCVKNEVMQKIKSGKVKMRSHLVFIAEKLGLESILAAALVFGTLLISILFYFLKKTGLPKFLSLGIPGLKIFLLTLPYDYIILFILSIILAIYFANKINLFCGECTNTDHFAIYFFVSAVILGIVFGYLGIGEHLKGWSKNKIPKESAISGKIKNFSGHEIILEDENGNLVKVFIETPETARADYYEKGKYFRAIGNQDREDMNLFHAQIIRCCDNE